MYYTHSEMEGSAEPQWVVRPLDMIHAPPLPPPRQYLFGRRPTGVGSALTVAVRHGTPHTP